MRRTAVMMSPLVVVPILDVIAFTTRSSGWARGAFWTETVGLVLGLLALIADVGTLHRRHPATRRFRMVFFQLGAYLTGLLLCLTAWLIRIGEGTVFVDAGTLACQVLGSLVLLAGAWWPAPFVDRLRIGLSEDPTAEAAARRAGRHQPTTT